MINFAPNNNLVVKLSALKKALGSSEGIKFNLKYRQGCFYLESVTGDITLIMDSSAFKKKGEIIAPIGPTV